MKTIFFKKTIVLLIFNTLLITTTTVANNLSISAVTTAGNTIMFTISWDNSWNTVAPANWDAVWVFAKYQDCAAPATWTHVPMNIGAVHTVAGGTGNLQADEVDDGMGVFIRRTAAGGPGTVSGDATLTMTMAAGTYNFKVFGIEMVNIPTGDFYVGDNSATGRFNNIQITSEGALTAAGACGTCYGGSGSVDLAANVPGVPAGTGYPKGYSQFYCMKYEISQEQYVDFLNTLTYTQQALYTQAAPDVVAGNWALYTGGSAGVARNGIVVVTSGVNPTTPAEYGCNLGGTTNNDAPNVTYNETFDGQNVACNFLACTDLEAYLDWAALRPMTDLEFEKICRGTTGSSVPGEYPWGNTQLTMACSRNTAGTNLGQNGVNELASNSAYNAQATGNGLCAYNNTCCGLTSTNNTVPRLVAGPLRVGFAATATTDRVTAGATFWGVLDMGGNVWEKCVNTNAAGSTFIGTLGDGDVSALPADWPTNNTTSMISRGSSWYNTQAIYLQTSNRSLWNTTTYLVRQAETGGRGVRQY